MADELLTGQSVADNVDVDVDTGTGVTPTTPAPVAHPIGADGSFSEGWTSMLPEDLREHASLAGFKSLPDLAKSLVNTKRMVGADKERFLFAPNENSTAEERAEFFRKLGCPESPDKYQVKLPDGAKADERMQAHFAKIAHERGLNNDSFQALVDGYNEYKAEEAQASQAEEAMKATEKFDEGVKQLQQEWRGRYDENLSVANRAVNEFGLKEFLDERGLSNDAEMVKVMHKIGSMLLESKGPDAHGTSSAAAGTQQQIDSIRNDKNNPYHNRDMPGHEQAVALMTQLYSKLG